MPTRLENFAIELEASGLYRVLRLLDPPAVYSDTPAYDTSLGLIVDTETTGLLANEDRIIQLALLPFTFSEQDGRILKREQVITYFEDPGKSIPVEISDLTKITDADVRGHRIDDQQVLELLGESAIVIAHQASFDRPFVERRIPEFEDVSWACSIADIPWRQYGFASTRLEYLLANHCSGFANFHRADVDCLATLHVLATPFPDGTLPFQHLWQSARTATTRLWAEGATIDDAPLLKARGYRWNDGTDGRPRAWFRDVSASRESEEVEWLESFVYSNSSNGWTKEVFDSRKRYSLGYQ